MGTIGIAYGNLTDAATITGSGWHASYPVTKVQNRDLGDYAQTTGSTAEFIIDHGVAVDAQVFSLQAHTAIDPVGDITVTRGTTSGGSDVLSLATVSTWPFAPLDDDFDGGHFAIWVIAPAVSSARYTKIAINNTGAMRFGRLFMGRLFLPTYNPKYGRIADNWQASASTADRTRGGAAQFWRRGRSQRAAPFEYTALPPSEASVWSEIERTHDVTAELGWIRHTHDRAVQQQRGFVGTLRQLSGLENPFFGHQSAAVALDEIGGAP